jgi:hypothetical protein
MDAAKGIKAEKQHGGAWMHEKAPELILHYP